MARTRRSRDSSARPQGQVPPQAFVPQRHEPRAWTTAGLAVALVWALLFLPQLFLGQRFVIGDSSAFRPFPEFSRARWHETGERTYWNPYVFMGIESVASLADPRPQYLPGPLLAATERLSEPGAAPQLWLLLAHLAGTLAIVALARRLWGADPWSAAAGGLTWLMAIPILSPLAHGYDAQILADALLPVVTLGTHVVLTSTRPRAVLGGALALALALGIQCLHGHPQIVVYSSTLILLFALHQAWTLGRWNRLLPWGAAVALGAAIGTAVWWPALLYSGLSSRGGDAQGVSLLVVAKYSLHWRDLPSLVWPQAVGFGGITYWGGLQVTDYAPYLGAVALTLALGGFRRAADRGDATSRFWWGVFLVSLALSLGVNLGGVFGFVHTHVPLWNKFRVPLYVLIGACLALALLVPRSLSRVAAPPAGPERWTSLRTVLVVLAALALAGLALGSGWAGPFYADLARTLRSAMDEVTANAAARFAGLDLVLRSALVACACALLLLARAGRAWARPALALLVALDLASVGAPALWRATGPPAAVEAPVPTPLAQVAARDPRARAYVGAARPVQDSAFARRRYVESYTNFWVSWRARCLTGDHGAFPSAWRKVMEYELTRSEPVLRAWGVGWLDLDRAVAPAATGLTPVAQDERARVYALDAPLGRAYAVPLVVALSDQDAVARAMAHPDFDPAVAAVTTDPGVAGEYPGSPDCAIRWIRDDPQWLVLETAAPDRAFLVVADSDFPGWSARVDGSLTRIAPTNLLVRGIPLAGGKHRVEMRYETPGMRAAVPVTRAGLGAWLACLLAWAGWTLQQRRRHAGA